MSDDGMLPAQRETLAALRVPKSERAVYTDEFRKELAARLESGVADVEVGERGLWVSKRDLTDVLRCERFFTEDRAVPFEWSVPIAIGIVLHKAVELTMHSDAAPSAAVEQAVSRAGADSSSLGQFISSMEDGDRDDLISSCVSFAERFSETFPDVKPAWRPAAETKARVRLRGGDVVLSAKYDLTIGRPESVDGGFRAGKAIIDLKTGSRRVSDPEDMLFYSLVETLSVGVPPMLAGTFYVAEGRLEAVEVNEQTLLAAADRAVKGTAALSRVRSAAADELSVVAGSQCSWCPVSADCEIGTRWLAVGEG